MFGNLSRISFISGSGSSSDVLPSRVPLSSHVPWHCFFLPGSSIWSLSSCFKLSMCVEILYNYYTPVQRPYIYSVKMVQKIKQKKKKNKNINYK